MPSATSSGADASKASGSARNRDHNQGNQERKYTPEQAAAVVRIRRCNATAFYEILELQKSCADNEIKKAYRKQSLLTHPDKNGHPHADEAFKMVSRAFGVLGEKDKRDMYDRSGADPDSRFAQAQAQNPFAGFANRGGGGMGQRRGGWNEEEISPEEMFRQFFGGGMFGGGFDTGPGFVFNMNGGPGIRIHQFGGARPRRRPREGEEDAQAQQSLWQTLVTLLPILIFFIIPLFQSLFSGFDSGPTYPTMNFDRAHNHMTHEQVTKNGVKFYISPKDWAPYKDQPSKIANLHNYADVTQIRVLDQKCNREMAYKQQLKDDATGFFWEDPVKMKAANEYAMPACERLQQLQHRRRA